jgi:hypothetical protein
LTPYVFGYASLVGLPEPLAVDGVELRPLPGRLRGYRRCWGAAMNNWEGGEAAKHFLDRDTGQRPRIRVAYLDLRPEAGSSVNGLALPVDAARLDSFDAREINYRRIDVSAAFEPEPPAGVASPDAVEEASAASVPAEARPGTPPSPPRVFTYVGLDAARERCRQGAADGDAFVSREYVSLIRAAFGRLGRDALAEFDRTTEPLPFPERDLQVVLSR